MANGNNNGNGVEAWKRTRHYQEEPESRIDWIKPDPVARPLPPPSTRQRTTTKAPKELPQQPRSVLQRAREFVSREVKPAIEKEVDIPGRKKVAVQRWREATGEFVTPKKKRGRPKGKTPRGRVPKRIPKRMRVQQYTRATRGIARPFEEPVYAEDLMGIPYEGEAEVGYTGGATDVLYHGEDLLGGGYGESFLDLEGHLDDISRMGADMLASPYEIPRRRPRRKR